ncbi:MAG: hypothetical protein V9G12_08280 [Microthrixaceae bacterium]
MGPVGVGPLVGERLEIRGREDGRSRRELGVVVPNRLGEAGELVRRRQRDRRLGGIAEGRRGEIAAQPGLGLLERGCCQIVGPHGVTQCRQGVGDVVDRRDRRAQVEVGPVAEHPADLELGRLGLRHRCVGVGMMAGDDAGELESTGLEDVAPLDRGLDPGGQGRDAFRRAAGSVDLRPGVGRQPAGVVERGAIADLRDQEGDLGRKLSFLGLGTIELECGGVRDGLGLVDLGTLHLVVGGPGRIGMVGRPADLAGVVGAERGGQYGGDARQVVLAAVGKPKPRRGTGVCCSDAGLVGSRVAGLERSETAACVAALAGDGGGSGERLDPLGSAPRLYSGGLRRPPERSPAPRVLRSWHRIRRSRPPRDGASAALRPSDARPVWPSPTTPGVPGGAPRPPRRPSRSCRCRGVCRAPRHRARREGSATTRLPPAVCVGASRWRRQHSTRPRRRTPPRRDWAEGLGELGAMKHGARRVRSTRCEL